MKKVWLQTSPLKWVRLLARRWSWPVVLAAAVFPASAGRPLVQTPAPKHSASEVARLGILIDRTLNQVQGPGHPASVSEEVLLDPSVEEPLPTHPSAIVRESMLEGLIADEQLLPTEPQTTRRSPLTLALDPFLLIFSGETSVLFDDNIFLSQLNPEADVLYTLTPRVAAGTGDYGEQKRTFIAGGFAPTFVIFQDHSKLSDIDYDTFLSAQYSLSRLKIGSRLSYQKLSGADRDASGRIKRDFYVADFVAEYALSQRTTLQAEGQATHRYYSTRIDSDEYFGRTFLAHSWSQKLQTALGGTYSAFRPANQLNQTAEELLLRVWYQSSPKLSIRAIGGVEFRQFEERISGRSTPVADLAVVYVPSPGENTVLSLGGYRRVQNSVSDPGQNYVSNGIAFRVNQRLWRDLYLDLGTGYQRISYYPVAREIVTQRKDHFYFVRSKIGYDFNRWGSLSLFYSWRENDSTAVGSSWKNNQVGVELAVGL